MLSAALEYLDSGYSIIPVRPDKKPYVKWVEYQSRLASRDEVEGWWKQWPDANIGIVTGEVSNVCVVDVDSKAGYKTVSELIPGIMPQVRSPGSGGWHWYFASKNGTRSTAGFLDKCDFRGDGGYIVAPPSIGTNGKRYRLIDGHDITRDNELPEAIIEALQKASLFDDKALFGPDEVEDWSDPSRAHDVTHTYTLRDTNVSLTSRARGVGGETTMPLQPSPEAEGATERLQKATKGYRVPSGERDHWLFHTALCLLKGGMRRDNILKNLVMIASSWGEAHEIQWFKAKVKAAIDFDGKKGQSFMDEVREWVGYTETTIKLHNGYTDLGLVAPKEKKHLRTCLQRLMEEGVLRKNSAGNYMRLDDNIEWMRDLDNVPTDPFDIIWPFEMEDLVNMASGGVVIVSGQQSAGKTAYLLSVAKVNANNPLPVYFLSTETNAQGLKVRIDGYKSEGHCVKDMMANVKFGYHGEGDIASTIQKHNMKDSIVIVDYLEVDAEFYAVGQRIAEIFRAMDKGIAIIGLQMHGDTPLGGRFSFHKPEIVLTLKADYEQMCTIATIEKARWWKGTRNPSRLKMPFTLRQGCILDPLRAAWDLLRDDE